MAVGAVAAAAGLPGRLWLWQEYEVCCCLGCGWKAKFAVALEVQLEAGLQKRFFFIVVAAGVGMRSSLFPWLLQEGGVCCFLGFSGCSGASLTVLFHLFR